MISRYITAVLGTLLAVSILANIGLGIWVYVGSKERTKLETELGVVAGLSQQQEVKVVEAKQIEERIKVVTQDKIKVVKEYVYDNNKSDCDNAIDLMRTVF